jgi:sulfur relay protein TusB/DsrH
VLVMIKSGPDTAEGAIGLALARESGADLVLLQNGVYFARAGAIGEWAGAVYLLEDDKRLRGLKDAELDARARTIGYDGLTDLITRDDAAVGMF